MKLLWVFVFVFLLATGVAVGRAHPYEALSVQYLFSPPKRRCCAVPPVCPRHPGDGCLRPFFPRSCDLVFLSIRANVFLTPLAIVSVASVFFFSI
ncbi:hypothetical protein F4820DRAFT_243123 [Hypoxylon rubiginosum]|uniref:Uncharacterized protein n=1 Tax=Hypoxylon rubiginosum TaxID=110542 RepID=A0ACB9Z6K2_9PEZI|nr:hypothetical protein F4820DRAFT_243123 [Hypoxylon rubiginosum]